MSNELQVWGLWTIFNVYVYYNNYLEYLYSTNLVVQCRFKHTVTISITQLY